MTTQYGFTKMNIQEFGAWVKENKIARTILTIQHHHTYTPSYSLFTGANHFSLQKGMRDFHVNDNGWDDIGQHFTTFPDGAILTGRSLEYSSACIYGQNANAICIENLGFFDTGNDEMTREQKETIVKMTALLCTKAGLEITDNSIVYHHWFDLRTGERNNGSGSNKSCPGTNFFGGNSVEACNNYFLPLVRKALQGTTVPVTVPEKIKYAAVTTRSLNIREQPHSDGKLIKGRSLSLGAVIRVYEERNGWSRISGSEQHWISSRYTTPVRRALVSTTLNVRSGPGTSFPIVSSYMAGQEIFIFDEVKQWCKTGVDNKWVSAAYLHFK